MNVIKSLSWLQVQVALHIVNLLWRDVDSNEAVKETHVEMTLNPLAHVLEKGLQKV